MSDKGLRARLRRLRAFLREAETLEAGVPPMFGAKMISSTSAAVSASSRGSVPLRGFSRRRALRFLRGGPEVLTCLMRMDNFLSRNHMGERVRSASKCQSHYNPKARG